VLVLCHSHSHLHFLRIGQSDFYRSCWEQWVKLQSLRQGCSMIARNRKLIVYGFLSPAILWFCTRHSSRAAFPTTRKWGTGLSIKRPRAASSASVKIASSSEQHLNLPAAPPTRISIPVWWLALLVHCVPVI